ncbi:hypothetical protein RUND412_007841 [Rhizina undulata]
MDFQQVTSLPTPPIKHFLHVLDMSGTYMPGTYMSELQYDNRFLHTIIPASGRLLLLELLLPVYRYASTTWLCEPCLVSWRGKYRGRAMALLMKETGRAVDVVPEVVDEDNTVC